MIPILDVHSDLSESLRYNHAQYPIYIHKDHLSRYGYRAACHWHVDLEFVYVLSGQMDYFVNGSIISMHEGQGIFVNSKRMHYGFSNEDNECDFLVLVVDPVSFFESGDYMNIYLQKMFGVYTENYVYLDKSSP